MSKISDIDFYQRNYLKILTKSSELLPLVPNRYQTELNKLVTNLRRDCKPVRIIVLKCRQIGISTWGTADTFHQCATKFYKKGIIIADDSDNTNNLFNMSKRYYDFLPDKIKPMKRYSNEKKLVFENPDEATRDKSPGLISSVNVETAQKLTAGRSGTVQHLHASEIAFWPNAGTVLTGMLQSVPLIGGTTVLLESTANGVAGRGGEFYERWCMAESGEGDFVPIFFPWQDNPEYEMDTPAGFKLTDYEKDLMERFPALTERKIYWRRYKIRNDMGSSLLNPVDQFKQEYPLYPEEAFISSGRPLFDIDKLKKDLERCKQIPFKLGVIDGSGSFREDKNGDVKVYQEPKNGSIYAIGADVSEGLEEGDLSAYFVIDKNYRQTCSYAGRIAPDLFGNLLCSSGLYYNEALLAPEKNNHGHTVVSKIRDNKYMNVYSRVVKEERVERRTRRIGWDTNKATKMKMLDEFVAAYRDGALDICDPDLIREMITLSIEPDGNVVLNGKDRVVAACIAVQAIKQASGNNLSAVVPGAIKNKPKTLMERNEQARKKEEWSY